MSLSCSTTIIVFPISLSFFNELISLLLSIWCNPMEGSSKMYKTSCNCDPICVANLIL